MCQQDPSEMYFHILFDDGSENDNLHLAGPILGIENAEKEFQRIASGGKFREDGLMICHFFE